MKNTFFTLLFTAFTVFHAQSQETVNIYAAQQDTALKLMQGFLHGGTQHLDSVKVARLKPAFWRLGAYWLAGSDYLSTKRFGPAITVNINDLYMIVNGITSQSQSRPWENQWQDWDNLVEMIVTNSILDNQPIDYWDPWGEPDVFWTGTPAQFIEMYRRTIARIKSIDPNARITGPEFGFADCNFNVQPILWFLDSLHAANTHVDGISWHELCNNPEETPAHVQQLRDSLAKRPWASDMPLHISEYSSPTSATIPGWSAGWLYYLEQARVDWVSHACWNESNGAQQWSNCEKGLNGLFMPDNQTPQPAYWVHRAYAELGQVRLKTASDHPKTIALAGRDDDSKQLTILAGRYDNPMLGQHHAASDLEINIVDYPFCVHCTQKLVIERIPSNDVPWSIPLEAPVPVFSGQVQFNNSMASVLLPAVVDGDAYVLKIQNDEGVPVQEPASIASPEFQVFPTLCSDHINMKSPEHQTCAFDILDTTGRVMLSWTSAGVSSISISGLPAGLYLIRSADIPGLVKRVVRL